MKGGDFQRADVLASQPAFWDHALELERHGCARRLTDGREEADALGADATERQREGRRRGTVQPLQVIHRHEHRPELREPAEHIQQCRADRPSVRA